MSLIEVAINFNYFNKKFTNSSLRLTFKSDKTIIIWNSDDGNQIKKLVGHSNPIKCLCISNDGNKIISGGKDKLIIIWNINNGL